MSRVASIITKARVRVLPIALGACLPLLAGLGAPPAALATECHNEAIRVKQESTYLPECRAYELVTQESAPALEPFGPRAAADGGAYAYVSKYPISGTQTSGYYYLARRGGSGWTVEAVAPQDTPSVLGNFVCGQALYYSADLDSSVLSDGWEIHEEAPTYPRCGKESEEVLAAGAPRGFGNLFMRTEGEPYQLINTTPATAEPANAVMQGASADLSHVVFRERAELLTGVPKKEYDLYEWTGGLLHLVSVAPGGEPAGGAELADGREPGAAASGNPRQAKSLATALHAVSEDGERVFFEAHNGLYVRTHALQPQSALSGGKCAEPEKACTVQVDATQGGEGTGGGGVFWYANADGSRVFFADESRLTATSFAIPGRADLYEYNVGTGVLTDLTPGRKVEPGFVRGFSGASEDGSYLYFVAESALTGAQQNASGAVAQPEAFNLYLEHEGTLTFIATLNAARDSGVWEETAKITNTNFLRARTSPNGRFLEFQSVDSLVPKEDNAPAKEGDCGAGAAPCSEAFLYEADPGVGALHCVSCGAAAPTGNTEVPLPSGPPLSERSPDYLSRAVLNGGQVFFTTPNKLVERDENEAEDVYEYREGQVSLISSGLSPSGAEFSEASESGEEVFFSTGASLVASDTNTGLNVYDARVEGGFEESSPSGGGSGPCTSVEGCRPPLREPPVEVFGASEAFSGPGDLVAVVPPAQEESAQGKQEGKHKHGLTRSQKLKRALRHCRRRHRRSARKRYVCVRQVRRRFARGHHGRRHGRRDRGRRHVKRRRHSKRRHG